jgi:hypothetical protein
LGAVEEWTPEKEEAFKEAVKKWVEVNGRNPTLEDEATIFESIAFPERHKRKEETA